MIKNLFVAFSKACKKGFQGFIEWIQSLLKKERKNIDNAERKSIKNYSKTEILTQLVQDNINKFYNSTHLEAIYKKALRLDMSLEDLRGFVKTGSLLKIERKFVTNEIDFFAKQKKNKFVLQKSKSIKGKHSQRDFDINNCGGEILHLDWQNVEIFEEGFGMVKKHLDRFESVEANRKMIKRLENIISGKLKPTDFDKRFYTHEIREYRRYKNLGIEDGINNSNLYENAHSGTLEDYKIFELDANKNSILYHPDVNQKLDFLDEEEKRLLGL